jgi:hypothetical protein
MVIGEKKAQASAPVAMQAVVASNGDVNAWKNFGRMRQMR